LEKKKKQGGRKDELGQGRERTRGRSWGDQRYRATLNGRARGMETKGKGRSMGGKK
jgi:hypothetical protein